ncbi:tyrosine recombinase XerC [Capsulimonas corticalis]|uniref:Tyrosine recombinase XerC n=1 Tax=Capsulimonas corticalis TaxID=2219043 RepID=A0A402CY56_9BACT|nr:tyrosine-type recombinase/integrase [Capsulimonas corticalis]BDI31462.1 tyrosine recombinase XerC [Capsulimonas corticalis]
METFNRQTVFSNDIDWQEAVSDFLLQTRTSREESTEVFYRERLKLLCRWAEGRKITLGDFRARHMREYLNERGEKVSDATRRHDAVAARTFFKFCKREEYVTADPLTGYQVPKAERPYVKCPSDDEIRALLTAVTDRYKPSINPKSRFIHAGARLFFGRRNYAIVAGLLETAARIGEMLALTVDDYQPKEGQIVIRKAKGDEPRIIPISSYWIQTVDAYLRVRPKVDSPLLFISEFGGEITVSEFGKVFRGYLDYASLSGFSLHGLRHYALTQLAKTDLWAASQIAGHKDLTVTRRYLHGDPVHVRSVHEAAAPLGRLLHTSRSANQGRKKIV